MREACAKPIRVVIADDHRLLREGLRALLERTGKIEVVGDASDGREAIALVRSTQPHVLLTDIGMKGMNGIEAVGRVAKEFPSVRVLILSMYGHEEYVWQSLRAGAAGYLVKDAGLAELESAIAAVARGETFLPASVSSRLVDQCMRRAANGYATQNGQTSVLAAAPLSPRHREILQLIAEGNTSKEIALVLGLSVKTVETHRTQLMDRLNIHDLAGLVRYAVRHRIVDPQT